MTRAPELRAINCTACGAGLDVRGGGRVLAHICPYCGTELAANDNYRALSKWQNLKRPTSPLKIGMTGPVRGVTFTVIGTLEMEERWGSQVWTWVDHQIYSPTHGYAWLTWEDGHLVLTRKYRGGTEPGWISSDTVERADHRPSVRADGRRFRYYETSTARITFAEGEFNWRPRMGDRFTTVSLLGEEAMLGFTDSPTEREVEITTWPPQAETLAAWGAEPQPKSPVRHPIRPAWRLREQGFMLTAGGIAAVICLVMGMVFSLDNGRVVLDERSLAIGALPAEIGFELTDTERLAIIFLGGDVSNSWAFIEAALTGPEGETIFEVGREVGYYHGRDSDGTWTEGSRDATLRFHPPQPGAYTLEIDVSEAGVWNRSGSPLSTVTVSARESASSGFWFFAAAGLMLLPGMLAAIGHAISSSRRWSGSDWVDEDDD